MANRRFVLRWIHLMAGCLLGTSIYSPISKQIPQSVFVLKILVVPVLVLTGILLWKHIKVGRALGLK